MSISVGLLESEYARVEANIDTARAIRADTEERARRIKDIHLQALAVRTAARAVVEEARELRQSRKKAAPSIEMPG